MQITRTKYKWNLSCTFYYAGYISFMTVYVASVSVGAAVFKDELLLATHDSVLSQADRLVFCFFIWKGKHSLKFHEKYFWSVFDGTLFHGFEKSSTMLIFVIVYIYHSL